LSLGLEQPEGEVTIYLDLVPRLGVRGTAHLQLKIKVTLEQSTKSQRGRRGIALHFL
jgi:hypothetical protein